MITDAVNAYVNTHQESWFQELSSQTLYNGLKITKKVSGLPVGLIVEFLPEENDIELYVKFDSKRVHGGCKKVSFPKSPRGTIAFSVLNKREKTDPRSITLLRREGKAHDVLNTSEHVLKGRLIKYKKWNSPDKKIGYGLRTEYMNRGSLSDYLKQGKRFTPQEMKAIASAIAAGVTDIHTTSEVWAHNDIKPANVFLNKNSDGKLTVKIADLGFIAKNGTEHSKRATPLYQSPESYFNLTSGSMLKDDIWALGLTFHQLLTGTRPDAFTNLNTFGELANVLSDPEKIRGKQPTKKTFHHLIWQMLHPKPHLRPTIEKVQKIIKSLPESAFTTTK
jgi:serine/threonine protein kinase